MSKVVVFFFILVSLSGCRFDSLSSDQSPQTSKLPDQESTTSLSSVSRPSETDIINNFFQLINTDQVADALLSMTDQITSDESAKQAWATQFNAFTTISVLSIKAINQSQWTDTTHQYQISLDITMDPSSADAPIPYYGYTNGLNTRFISLVNQAGLWRIDSINTGP